MPSYRLFGGTLRSSIAFPELDAVPDEAPSWTLERVDTEAPEFDGDHIGSDAVFGSVRVHAHRGAHGMRLVFDDTGVFDISADGTRIRWHAPADANEEAMRADVTGRVLAASLHLQGTLSLHASGVSVGGAGIAFLAPKFHGKSTLAAALVRAGAGLLTDDTLPVDLGRPARLRPGVQRVRLWNDAVPGGRIETRTLPFAAAYVLEPVSVEDAPEPVRREALAPLQATMALMRHAKLAPMLGGREAPRLLQLAAEVANVVPVYRLEVVRALDALDEVVARLLAWHASGAALVGDGVVA